MNLILKYFPELPQEQQLLFRRLTAQYIIWNSKINVISRKDVENLEMHHVLHSLSIAKVIQFKSGTAVVDIGTGGGFPGIPLAIMFPSVKFHLVDSIKKKIMVAQAIATELQLANVTTEWQRAENISGEYDFAVSRAVTDLQTLCSWMKNKIRKGNFNIIKNGLLCLKGGNVTSEINIIKKNVITYPICTFFEENFFREKVVLHVEW